MQRRQQRGHYYNWPWHCDECREEFEDRCRWMRSLRDENGERLPVRTGERVARWEKEENRRFADRMRFDQSKVWEWNWNKEQAGE